MPFVVDINTRETTKLDTALQAINFFSQIKLNLKYDALASTFQFDYLFDANKDDHLEVAGITHYHEAHVYWLDLDGVKKRVLTGFVVSQNFIDSPVPELLSIGGYSKPGILEQSDIPPSIPLESNGLKLSDIIRKVCKVFGSVNNPLNFKIETSKASGIILAPQKNTTENKTEKSAQNKQLAEYLANNGVVQDPGKKTKQQLAEGTIKKTTSKSSENAGSYLKKLCLQKNIILSHNEFGEVVVNTPNTEGIMVLILNADENPQQGYQRMNLNIDGTSIFREYFSISQSDDEGGNASKGYYKNPLSPIIAYPSVKVENQTSGDDITAQEVAQNSFSKSLKSIVLTINIVTDTISTKLILPNNTILIQNKKLNMFHPVKWFIESVEVTQTPESTTQVLTCVLPWVYNYYSQGLDKTKPAGPYNVFIEHGKNAPGQ